MRLIMAVSGQGVHTYHYTHDLLRSSTTVLHCSLYYLHWPGPTILIPWPGHLYTYILSLGGALVGPSIITPPARCTAQCIWEQIRVRRCNLILRTLARRGLGWLQCNDNWWYLPECSICAIMYPPRCKLYCTSLNYTEHCTLHEVQTFQIAFLTPAGWHRWICCNASRVHTAQWWLGWRRRGGRRDGKQFGDHWRCQGGRHGGERQMRGGWEVGTRENQVEKLRGHYIWLNCNMYLGTVLWGK